MALQVTCVGKVARAGARPGMVDDTNDDLRARRQGACKWLAELGLLTCARPRCGAAFPGLLG